NGFSSPLDLNQIAVTKDTKTTYEKLFGTTSTSSSTSSSSK
ncbi:MAG: N-acetylmuramoyl-L-alanine amidase, partial [Streptococcus sp.]|nr:N-acetylmuramoyl-L-alanine amidase [Streptococcus sp.]